MSETAVHDLTPSSPGSSGVSRGGYFRSGEFRFLLVVVAAFVVACFLPALHFEGDPTDLGSGLSLLMIGPFAIFLGQFGWYANPLLLVSLILSQRRHFAAASVVGGLALLFSLQALQLWGTSIPLDEGGVHHATVQGMGPGFHLWILCMASSFLWPLWMRLRPRKEAGRR